MFSHGVLSHTYLQIVWELFRRYDLDMDGSLAPAEFRLLYSRATKSMPVSGDGEVLWRCSEQLLHHQTEEELAAVMAKLDQRPDKGVTRDGLASFFSKLSADEIVASLQ